MKRLIFKHRYEMVEDLQLDEAIACPVCIIGNCYGGCYTYCGGCCDCNHNECDNCDMTCHSYPKLNKNDDNCRCNCDHSKCDTNDTEENEEYCDGSCHEECTYLIYNNGDKQVVAVILKYALSISKNIFNKYNDLFNPNNKYFKKPYTV